MGIRINIPDNRCRAGSTISGTVSLHGDEDIDVQYITITLQARCKTKVTKSGGNNSNNTYRGRAPLFHIKKELFIGPHTLHPGHSWPFTLTLPMRCTARQTDRFKQQSGPFNSDHGQALPPALMDSNMSFGFGWNAESFIRYELEASLVGAKAKLLFGNGDFSCTRQLDFTTSRSVQTPDPQLTRKTQPIACYSLRLRPGYEDAALSFKEKLKSMRTSKLPVAVFKIDMLLPKVGVAGQPLPAFLNLDHDFERSTAQEPPIILLRKCSIDLQALTYIQCIRDEILRDGDEQRDWDTDHQIASCDFSEHMEKAPPVTENFDLRDVMKIRIPAYHTPTFSTFNIRRTYRLLLKVSVECAQKTFKAEFNSSNFTLLAKDFSPSVEGLAGSSSSYMGEQMEVAPAYHEDRGPAPPSYQDAKVP